MFSMPYFRRRDGRSYRAASASAAYTPLQVAKAYGIPLAGQGIGQTIGIIELGGAFSQLDLDTYLAALGVAKNIVTVVSVAGGGQHNDPGGANIEVMLDVCIVAALCPKAHIRLYFAPNSDQGFSQAISQAVTDGCDEVSISWGGPENQWTSSGITLMNRALTTAVKANVSVFVASGDNGSGDGQPGSHVDYPASDPGSIGVGGTTLRLNNDGTILGETVWGSKTGGATGGGYSVDFPQPVYQVGKVNSTKRGVPDVCAVADPETGWIIRADGASTSVGGTSAAAPFWACICALMNQKAGKRLGFLNALLYLHPEALRDTVTGSNGDYQAGPSWDACTGLGSPNGAPLFALAGGVIITPPPPPPSPPPPPPVAAGEIILKGKLDAGQWYALVHTTPGNRRYPAVLQAVTQVVPSNYILFANLGKLMVEPTPGSVVGVDPVEIAGVEVVHDETDGATDKAA